MEQCARLLEHAGKFDLASYVAFGLFAGLRASELERIDWSKVKLAERIITVDASASKVRSRRNVEINDTLAVWLKLCVKKSGPVSKSSQLPRPSQVTCYGGGHLRLAAQRTASFIWQLPFSDAQRRLEDRLPDG